MAVHMTQEKESTVKEYLVKNDFPESFRTTNYGFVSVTRESRAPLNTTLDSAECMAFLYSHVMPAMCP